MEIIVGSIVFLKTDDGNNINLQSIDSIRVLPEEDAGDNKNIIEASVGGNAIQVTNYSTRNEAEEKLNQILSAQQTYTTNGLSFNAPPGHYEVKNIYVNSETGKLVITYSDVPVPII